MTLFEIFTPNPERTKAKGKIASGAIAKVSPKVKRILNNKPPEASPKRFFISFFYLKMGAGRNREAILCLKMEADVDNKYSLYRKMEAG
mgnify:CR=1 FL=1